MEYPGTWDMLTASLNGDRLEQPLLAWAFLVVQGLVRDEPGDRETFCRLVEENKEPITGPSSGRRIAGALRQLGLALPQSEQPDPFAETAAQRWALLTRWQHWTPTVPAPEPVPPPSPHWLPPPPPVPLPIPFSYCIFCGVRHEEMPPDNACLVCHLSWPDLATTRVKPCPNCNIGNFLTARFCENCGTEFAAQPIPPSLPEPPPPKMLQSRYLQLYDEPQTLAQVAIKTNNLHHVLWSALQDLWVMKEILLEKGVWDEARYRALRTCCMIGDHGGPGPAPWQASSQYPYTLDEDEFLRHQFKATDDEIEEFEAAIENVQTLT